MANRKTRNADFVTLNKLLAEGQGSRSLRAYAKTAGVETSLLYRIKNGKYCPGYTVLEKLAGAAEDPKDGKFLTELLAAAGYEINPEAINKAFEVISAAAHIAQERKTFQDAAMKIIATALARKKVSYDVGDTQEHYYLTYQPDVWLKLHAHEFTQLWFSFYAPGNSDENANSRSIDQAADLIRQPLTVKPNQFRKIFIVVQNRAVFKELQHFAGFTAFRGWLSAILIDTDSNRIVGEKTIATFSGEDDLDPLTLADT